MGNLLQAVTAALLKARATRLKQSLYTVVVVNAEIDKLHIGV
jgi:hypothetical protein